MQLTIITAIVSLWLPASTASLAAEPTHTDLDALLSACAGGASLNEIEAHTSAFVQVADTHLYDNKSYRSFVGDMSKYDMTAVGIDTLVFLGQDAQLEQRRQFEALGMSVQSSVTPRGTSWDISDFRLLQHPDFALRVYESSGPSFTGNVCTLVSFENGAVDNALAQFEAIGSVRSSLGTTTRLDGPHPDVIIAHLTTSPNANSEAMFSTMPPMNAYTQIIAPTHSLNRQP